MNGPGESRRWDGGERTEAVVRWHGSERTDTGIAVRTTGAQLPPPTPASAPAQADDCWHRQGLRGPLTGQIFADYEIGTVLGEGGMGTVYRARQISLGRRVAVKTLGSAIGNEPLQRARFEIEARAASLIQSPHVVAVHAAGSWDGTAYFVMEYVEGSDLGSLIEAQGGRGLGHNRALELAMQAARGLSAAASKGIVHRDIKPGNLLLTRDGILKIADFGVSKIGGASDLTRTGTAVGTPSYLSPEQGRGEPTDTRSDIYSLGCVLYEVLTGRRPFIGDNADAVIYQHNYAEPPLPRDLDQAIPEPVQALVVRCLQKDPARRYQTADELIRDIEAIRAGDVSVTALLQARYGTGAEEQMRRRLGRRNRWAPAVAAALILAAGAAGTLVWRQSTAEARAQDRRTGEILRMRLHEALDRVQPPPPGSRDDLAALARLAGDRDDDVRRWRGRVDALDAVEARLARLHGDALPGAAVRAEAAADLASLADLVGPASPLAARCEARLAETEAEIRRLRQLLAEFDRDAEATVALRERLDAPLTAFAALVGAHDADLTRWRRRLATMDERIAGLRRGLAALDQTGVTVDADALGRHGEALEAIARLRGSVPADPDELRWRAAVASHRAAIARLRDRLARLDAADPLDEAALAQLEPDLAAYRLRVLPDDADRLRWDGRLESARRRVADLRRRCDVLDHAGDLPLPRLDDARAALAELRLLAATDDADVAKRALALAEADRTLAGWRGDLAVLAEPAAVTVRAQQRAQAALTALAARLAVDDAAQRGAEQRLAAEARQLADLRTRCAVADDPGVRVSSALADDISLYGHLMGDADADFQRWRARIVDFLALRRRLAPLDRAEALPDSVDADLTAMAAIAGAADATMAAWRSKVQRVRSLQTALAVLDRPAAAPGDTATALDELHSLVGAYPQEPAWRAKLARIRRLEAACAARLGDGNVLLASDAAAVLDELEAETGSTPALAAWRVRAGVLAGPAAPAWASDGGSDGMGRRVLMSLPGDAQQRIAFRYVPPGAFSIGSPAGEPGRDADEIAVGIRLTRGRWMSETEISEATWARVMGGASPGSDLPVRRVSWDDANAFCARLSQALGVRARLPTEAEWEHACRAGGSDPTLAAGQPDALQRAAWYRDSSDDACHAVGRRPPNALGLHDMLGNVWEWCSDRYGLYPATGATDPQGGDQEQRVVRGGGWADPARLLRAANRAALDPRTRSEQVGFRVVVE